MFGLLALAFIAMPILEIWLILEIGGQLGLLNTIGVIIVTAVVGAALAKHQGLAALQKVQRALQTGEQVGTSMIEAALILVAAVMMLLPGFVTDGMGILLLLPPTRKLVAAVIARRFANRAQSFVVGSFDPMGMGGVYGDDDDRDPPPPGVIDV